MWTKIHCCLEKTEIIPRPAAPLAGRKLSLTFWNGIFPYRKGTKKDVEPSFSPSPILIIRLSHCPFVRNKQLKALPTPSDIINPLRPDNSRHIYHDTLHPQGELHLIYIYKERGRGGIRNSPTRTLLLHYRCTKFQICEIWWFRQVTCWKRPFETGRTTGLKSLPSMSKFTAYPH